MKICIMTSVHHYDDVRIYHKEAQTLRAQGFEVTIICPDFEGTDKNGIEFVRVDMPNSRFARIITAPFRFLKAAKKVNAKSYHFHDPELILTGIFLKKNAKVIYDIHEDVPRQILTKPYLKPFIAKISSRIVESFENYGARQFYAIIAAAPVIYDRMIKQNKNTILVCNYPKLEEFEDMSNDGKTRENKVCYIGGITKIRGIFEMVDAVNDLDVKLVLAGAFETDALKKQAEQRPGYQNVDYKGFLNREEIREVLSTSKAGLVTLYPTPTYMLSLPIKMFEYMIAEIPVIASDFPYWQDIVDDAKCGLCINPLDVNEIKAAIAYIIKNDDIAQEMGQNGRRMVLEKYNWDIEKKKLIILYNFQSDSIKHKEKVV
ncbi:MAG: glycosyltransferase family 4 protein [Oscillospiraceae bacterium]